MNVNELLKYFKDSHYVHPLFLGICIVALTISLRSNRKKSSLKLFNYYFSGFIVLNLGIYTFKLFPSTTTVLMNGYLDYSFTIFEYLIFVSYIYLKILKRFKRILVIINSIIFLILSLFLIARDLGSHGNLQ